MGDLFGCKIDPGEAGLREASCKDPELGPDSAADLQDMLAPREIDRLVNPGDEMLRLMDQPLLFLGGKGVDVSLGHGRHVRGSHPISLAYGAG